MVTFGIKPTVPETGYGYIECGETYKVGSYHVQRFVEKPALALAMEYVASDKYLWNSGFFCFKAATLLESLKKHAPAIYASVLLCWEQTQQKNKFTNTIEIDQASFADIDEISIDYAVMEKANNVVIVPGTFGWNDIGSWEAVSKLVPLDMSGNSALGETLLLDVSNTYVQTESRLVAAIGVENMFIIDTPDALLVAHKKAQEIKKLLRN